jgi:hypothetical protein
LTSESGSQKPIRFQGTLNEATYNFVVASKNDTADYHFTIKATPSDAPYGSDNSLLQGEYYRHPATALLERWEFDGDEVYRIWLWTALSGDYCSESGYYQVWYPHLILVSEEGTKLLELEILSQTTFVADGLRYVRE